MKDKILSLLPKIILVIIGLNILILDILLIKDKRASQPVVSPKQDSLQEAALPQEQAQCSTACQQEMAEMISSSLATFSGEETVIKEIVREETKFIPSAEAQPRTIYIPLLTSASTTEMDWVDIVPSDFYFDLADYSGIKSVHFDVYLKALHGSGRVYVRLYDVTNKRGVDYSDHSTQAADFELMRSSPLAIWQGNNLYRIQMKSINGTEAFLEQAKLRVVLE